MLCVDTSGSFDGANALAGSANDLASQLVADGDVQVGRLSFGNGAISNFEGLTDSPSAYPNLANTGNTPMPAALEIAAAELDANGRSSAESFIVLFTDGGPNYENQQYSVNGYSVGGGYLADGPCARQ